jgi:hypothetical protein
MPGGEILVRSNLAQIAFPGFRALFCDYGVLRALIAPRCDKALLEFEADALRAAGLPDG